ncbi:uncharacterized protein BJ212DRAFT_1479097 [Suillus subaureus]|uniref:Uncharacterized protein n=1 Tax=Suillus subaureus TaxID=48587 RepID=A0A9P7JF53_9AGAM|nr:uncharacterized protein BJ212DRAFT_1479097 [Suillus subaureus]KAG1818973.1 hypothetical protein BJ212DRAFT_1479097 [Suillus subaureus]
MASAVVAATVPLVPLRMVLDGTKNSSPEQDQQDQQPANFTEGPLFEGGSDIADATSISRDSDACQCSESDTSMGIPTCITLSSLPIMPSAHPNLDAFKTEYHPHSGRATSVESFSTFGHKEHQLPPIVDNKPWQPFACRADFEFTELAHQAALNKSQTDELLRLIWRIADGQVKFMFKSHGNVSKAWDRAASQMSPFKKHTITVEHKQEDLEYNISSTDNTSTYLTRSSDEMKALVELWTRDRVAGESALKKQGLRPIKNIFWKVPNSDPHDMISQDHLHVYHMGQWKHLFSMLKQHIAALGRSAKKKLDNHNGNKLQDISKQVLYATQNILTCAADEAGYALLWCIASYLHIDMYISLDMQTESTIAAGRAEVLEFQKHLEDYIEIVKETDLDTIKNWNFPKIHSGKHIFDDIMAKVVLSALMRNNCNLMLTQEELEDMDLDDEKCEEHFHIGSPLKNQTTLSQVEEENKSIHAFHQFQKKLATFLNNFLPSHNIPLPEGTTWLKLSAQDQFIDITYLFTCPEYPPSSSNSQVKLPHFIAYALSSLHIFACPEYPPSSSNSQLLKARFPTAWGSLGHRLFISAFMLASKVICDNTYSNKSWSIVAVDPVMLTVFSVSAFILIQDNPSTYHKSLPASSSCIGPHAFIWPLVSAHTEPLYSH